MYVITKRATVPIYQLQWIYRRSKFYEIEQKHYNNGLFKLGEKVLREKEARISENMDDPQGKPQTFIDQLFKTPELFSTEQKQNEVNTMIIAVCTQMERKFGSS